jgi:hypothetical protein
MINNLDFIFVFGSYYFKTQKNSTAFMKELVNF